LHQKNHFLIVEIIATSIVLVAIFHCNRVNNTVHQSLRPAAQVGRDLTITKKADLMIRTSHSVLSSAMRGGFHKFFGAALVAAAAVAAPAHADVIGFEGYSGIVGGTEVWTESGYNVGFYANVAGGGAGTLVGQFFNNDDSTCDSASMACPVGHAGTYYGALNDSYIDIWSDINRPFYFKSFDAGFIGGNPNLSSYPAVPALVRVQAFKADGSYLTQDFALPRAATGGFQFGHFDTTGAFANTYFVEALVFGLVCNNAGSCSAFNSDRAQFGIDNIALVPEPGTIAMLGLGLMGLLGARRRKS
jgi:hypothetical protein